MVWKVLLRNGTPIGTGRVRKIWTHENPREEVFQGKVQAVHRSGLAVSSELA